MMTRYARTICGRACCHLRACVQLAASERDHCCLETSAMQLKHADGCSPTPASSGPMRHMIVVVLTAATAALLLLLLLPVSTHAALKAKVSRATDP